MSIKSKGGFYYLLWAVPLAIIVLTAAWASLFSDGGLGKLIIKCVSKLLDFLPFSNFICNRASEIFDISRDVFIKNEYLTVEKQILGTIKDSFKLLAGAIIFPYVSAIFGGRHSKETYTFGKHSISIEMLLLKVLSKFLIPIFISIGTGYIFDLLSDKIGDRLIVIIGSISTPFIICLIIFLILKISGLGIGWTMSFISYKLISKLLINVFVNAFLSCIFVLTIVGIYNSDMQMGLIALVLAAIYLFLIGVTDYVMDNADGSWKQRLVWKAGLDGISPKKLSSWLWF